MRMFLIGMIVLIAVYIYFAGDGESVVASGEPIVTIYPTSMPTSAPALAITVQATMTPIPHGTPQRMRFQVGTYGGSYASGTWVLWVAKGQTLRIAAEAGMVARLTGPDASDVGISAAGASLLVSGDYTLTVAGVDQFSIEVR